jgi:hypothetical protein
VVGALLRRQLEVCVFSSGSGVADSLPIRLQILKVEMALHIFGTDLAENSIRPIAVGRKNWIHVGSPQAGPKVAAILSIFETCRRIKLSVREYLSAVLPGLANLQLQCLSDLTPTVWTGQHKSSNSQRVR